MEILTCDPLMYKEPSRAYSIRQDGRINKNVELMLKHVFFSLLPGEDKKTWIQNQGADHSTDLRQPAVRFTVQDI